jgi:hypothetical protein
MSRGGEIFAALEHIRWAFPVDPKIIPAETAKIGKAAVIRNTRNRGSDIRRFQHPFGMLQAQLFDECRW